MHRIDTDRESDGFGSKRQTRLKLEDLEARLARLGRAAIAFSGGVDSTFLLAVAVKVLGDRAVAFTAVSPSLHPEELAEARALADDLGATHCEVETREMEDSRYRENNPRRCYFCKTHLFTTVSEAAKERGIDVVLDGNNLDDTRDYRPGLEASREFGVRSPLIEVGLTKREIRSLAREQGLPVWDKPAMPCLASRIPYFSPVTVEKLDQIGRAEQLLRTMGFPVVRVRHHGEVARIEVEPGRIADLVAPAVRERVEEALEALGFAFVTVDLSGYRSGKLNRVLDETSS